MKQFLYVFIVVSAITVIALIGYFLYYRTATEPLPTENQLGALPGIPPSAGQSTQIVTTSTVGQQTGNVLAGQKFGVVAQNPVVNFYADSQNNTILVQPDGQIVKITNGNASVLSSPTIPNLISASFSFDGKKILALFGDRANPQASLFDAEIKAWQPLAQNFQAAAWSPNSYQIIYLTNKNGAQVFTVFDPTNAKTKPIELITLHINDVALQWTGPNKVMISDKGSVLAPGSVWFFDLKNKTLSPLVMNKLGLQSAWSDAAGMGLIFGTKTGGFGGVLGLINSTTGQTLNTLTLLTLPSKCVFDVQAQNATTTTSSASTSSKPVPAQVASPAIVQKTLYCAVPRNTRELDASVLPDDYLKKAIFTTDDFYKIDLATGNASALFADPSQNLDAIDLKIFNRVLFFVNRFDQKLYSLSL